MKTEPPYVQLSIKHMVCARCVETVRELLREADLPPVSVSLGEVLLRRSPSVEQLAALSRKLKNHGFALIETESARLLNQVKALIVERVHHGRGEPHLKLSAYLAKHTGCDYARLSKLFSTVESMTIERYATRQRIEKVKELLVYDENSISEIAELMDYSSPAHLSAQFKQVTGMTPRAFRKLGASGRVGLEKL